jgi:hypothetical protein
MTQGRRPIAQRSDLRRAFGPAGSRRPLFWVRWCRSCRPPGSFPRGTPVVVGPRVRRRRFLRRIARFTGARASASTLGAGRTLPPPAVSVVRMPGTLRLLRVGRRGYSLWPRRPRRAGQSFR